ncbi:MAG: Na+/H+ antiporter NhaC [Deltaproteobacteria bacterium]|nr:Na+/H+ antiporter NhaC [Deltaproteobacteria bacterium]
MHDDVRCRSLWLALTPMLFLVTLLAFNLKLYGDGAAAGPNQVALLLSAMFATCVGVFALGIPYKNIESAILESTSHILQAILILLVVGALISLWILSGIVPTLIYYGLKLLSSSIFLPVSCVICTIVSLATGSSWSTAGTVGVALIAVGKALGIPEGLVAGAIISGAYFGDKMSPLSDTTNMASAMAGVDLFDHVRHMLYTTVPAYTLAILGFVITGFFVTPAGGADGNITEVLGVITQNFNVGPQHLFVPLLVLFLIRRKIAALPALAVGCVLAVPSALLFQQQFLHQTLGESYDGASVFKMIISTAANGFSSKTGSSLVDGLLSQGGISKMLSTLWLLISAMVFGGALEGSGMLARISQALLSSVRKTVSLIGATLASCLFVNMTVGDQYLAIVLPGRMFRSIYARYKLDARNLSRALEDAGTVTSVLVPWNSCGAYHAATLGVATLTYLPFCFFNIASPLVSFALAALGWTILKSSESQEEQKSDAISIPDQKRVSSFSERNA